MANSNFHKARKGKNDEFYTRWIDIEREMNAYLEYDPDAFRGKTLLLPCDDPEWSNFTKYFALHFRSLGLKKLISTSYAPEAKLDFVGEVWQPTLFETEHPQYDEEKSRRRGKKFVLDSEDVNGDGKIDIDDLKWEYLEGDGDFRSAEVIALRNEADIVVTNPPFSIFREFIAWLIEGNVQFSVIGNQGAVIYKEMFSLFANNSVWLGTPRGGGNEMYFRVPPNYAGGSGVYWEDGNKFVSVASRWFTNINHTRRGDMLQLMTMADNLKFNKRFIKTLNGATEYQRYDNYDAIECPTTSSIPADYTVKKWVNNEELTQLLDDGFKIEIIERERESSREGAEPRDGSTDHVPRQVLSDPIPDCGNNRERTSARNDKTTPPQETQRAIHSREKEVCSNLDSTKHLTLVEILNPLIGVPITFLDKYNPNQFEVVAYTRKGSCPQHWLLDYKGGHSEPHINGKAKYLRLLIRYNLT